MSAPVHPAEAAAPRIVKAHAVNGLGTPVEFNSVDLRRACDEHLAGVVDRARQLLDEASAEAARIRQAALEIGRSDGYRDGKKAAEADIEARLDRLANERLAAQLETLVPAMQQLADGPRMERDRWVARWEGEEVQLAVSIAEKLLRRTLQIDPSAANSMIAETLRTSAGTPHLTVRLSPADHARLGGSLEIVAGAVGQLGDTETIADPTITPGGCVIETRYGRVDGRLETMLSRIASELSGPPDVAPREQA